MGESPTHTCNTCVGRKELFSEVSYGISSTFKDNIGRFSDPSIDSTYGWVPKNDAVGEHITLLMSQPSHVSGIYHTGAAMGGIGTTQFTVKYSTSTPPGNSTFIYSAYSNTTGSNIFTSDGDRCKINFTIFQRVYHITALIITPLTWRTPEHPAINAPGMRVGIEICI